MSRSWHNAAPNLARWRRIRLLVLARDLYTCQIKGPKCVHVATAVDHIRGVGRSEDIKDLRAACVPCNSAYRPPSDPPITGRTQW